MLITLAILTLIASIDWSAIPDAVSEWLDAFDLAAEVRGDECGIYYEDRA